MQTRHLLLLVCVVLLTGFFMACTDAVSSPQPASPATPAPPANPEIPAPEPAAPVVTSFGHAAVGGFANLSTAQKDKVRGLKIYFEHASVGANVMKGLKTLAASEPIAIGGSAASALDNPDHPTSASAICSWFATHDGIADNARGNPAFTAKLSGFTAAMTDAATPVGAVADVAFMKFCWIDNKGNDSALAAADVQRYRDEITTLQLAFPGVSFIFVTMPVSTDDDCAYQAAFNAALRTWCADKHQWLYDFADIESHDAAGNLTISAAGWPSIVPAFAADAGHLNAAGQERAAKALWTTLAAIAASRP